VTVRAASSHSLARAAAASPRFPPAARLGSSAPLTLRRSRRFVAFFSARGRGFAAPIGYRLSVIGYRPSAIGYRLSAIGYRPSAIGYRPSAIGYRSIAVS
jgi:hypothetical protein